MGLREQLDTYGVKPHRLTKALVYYLVINFTYTNGLIGICYQLSPTNFIVNKLPFQGPKTKLAQLLEKPTNWEFMRFIAPQKRGAVSVAICEMLVLKNLLRPVVMPAIFWAAYKLTAD